ncbi:MAG: isoprenylcysteine carboxylmethyltransferase family protein [Gammaproteobacteria bacterium]|nr:isoprenylcysteine carboxylmethyltransferase family protein [Gammaproteobacteria bacterium]
MQATENVCPRILAYRPPRIAMSLLIIAAFAELVTPTNWGGLPSFPAAATGIGLCGFGLMIRAWWLFKIQETAICPTAETTVLITSDVYRLTRNPMYLGIVMMLLGVGLYLANIFYFIAAAAFFSIINYSFCPYEEARLRSVFPDEFTEYMKKVRRWL